MFSAKYSRLPTSEPEADDADLIKPTVSLFPVASPSVPNYFSYEVPKQKYKSAFTYAGDFNPNARLEQVPPAAPPSLLCRSCAAVAIILSYILFAITLPFSAIFTVKNIKTYERVVVFRLGRLLATMGPGYILVLPCIDRWTRIDLRMKVFCVPPQKIITADGAIIEIGAEVYFRIKDPVLSVNNVQNMNYSTRTLCQTMLQKHTSKQLLNDIETDKKNIANLLQDDANHTTLSWGVEISKIEISDIKILQKPNSFTSSPSNTLEMLGNVLFPPGISDAPIQQLQQFFTGVHGQKSSAGVSCEDPRLVPETCTMSGSDLEPGGSTSSISLQDVIEVVSRNLNSSVVKDFGTMFKFVIVGAGAHNTLFLDLKHGDGQIGVGSPPTEPDVTMTMTSDLLNELLTEQIVLRIFIAVYINSSENPIKHRIDLDQQRVLIIPGTERNAGTNSDWLQATASSCDWLAGLPFDFFVYL